MNSDALVLRPGEWFGLHEWPVEPPSWGGSPIYVTAVSPLKTGQGLLRLSFVHAFRPGGGARRSLELKIVSRTPDYLVGVVSAPAGPKRTVVVATADFAWLEASCARVWDRIRRTEPTPFHSGHRDAAEYLATAFGRDEREALNGAVSTSFPGRAPEMPAAHALFTVDIALPPLESWFASRGLVPRDMEEKWFVYKDEDRLLFRRSWTGNLIYDVEAVWRGDSLYLGQARVNRDPEQYGETDDAYDRAMLLWIIDVVLLRRLSPFPSKDSESAEVAIQAWSAAGSASLA